ncbi:MAG: rRNA methyltransferase [Methylophilales bacterium 16-45-7]|nr:MAG: rRNA methyltransferase [Methylophilales bacterium 16-45-7]
MAFKHITSRENPVFKQLKKLAESARERHREALTLLDGVHLIEAYHQVFGEPHMLVIPEGKSSLEATQLLQHLQDVHTVMFPTLMFAELTPVASSTGILALVKIPQIPPPEEADFALMLEDIQDPGNMGSMLRTAAAAGVQVVYLSKGCTDAWSPKALRGGQGAQFVLPIVEQADLLPNLSNFNGNSYAMTMQGQSLYTQNFLSPSLFVIGNEGAGLSSSVVNAVDHSITIPMANTITLAVESLNAAAATAICLFECQRQRS